MTFDRVRAAFSLRRNLTSLFVPPAGHLRPLDGLRALSVLWVVVFHTGWFARFALTPENWLRFVFNPWMLPIWRGDFGVDLFFVLSGFLIAGMLQDERVRTGHVALGLFYLRRLMRLWPALLVAVCLTLLSEDPNRSRVWANALYLNDFMPVGLVPLGWTWSLAIEEQFYLVCPWILRAAASLGTAGRVAVVGGCMLALTLVAVGVVVAYDVRPWDAEILGSPNMLRWGQVFDVFYDKPWMRAGALLAGVMGAILYREPRVMSALAGAGWIVGPLVGLALLTMALATHWPLIVGSSRIVEIAYLATFRTVFASAAAFIVLVTLSAHPIGRLLAKPLSSRVLYPFSQLAYSAYLLNPMVTVFHEMRMTAQVAHGEEPMHIFAPVTVVSTFVCAAILHVFVERPVMQLRPGRS